MSQHDTLTQALQQIADWNSHTTEYAVDYGSNGVRDFYRNIARAALAAPAGKGEPVYQVASAFVDDKPFTWRDATKDAYDMHMPGKRRVLYTTPPAQVQEGKQN